MKTLSKLLFALLVISACSKPVPRRTLRSGMLEIDGDFRELRTILTVPAKSERSKLLVQRMRAWADEPIFVNRPESPVFKGDGEKFRQFHALYAQRVDELVTAVETSDPRAMMAYAKVNMTCELCHAEFRPGL